MDSSNYSGSKHFEDKYVRAANERISRGPQPLVAPQEDKLLKDMKQ